MTFLSSLLFVSLAAAQVAVPPLKARVTDLTGTLNAQQSAALEHTLAEFEHRKGAQIAVLMVPSTRPETVEQYAVRVEESWKLGRKGVDDSVLLVIARNDRRLRIEVGYGLEGALPDAVARRILEEDITPRFKQGDFYGGIRAGTDRIMRIVEGEKLPDPDDWLWEKWRTPLAIAGVLALGLVAWIFIRVLPHWRSARLPVLVGAAAGTAIWLGKGEAVLAVFGGFAALAFAIAFAAIIRDGAVMATRRRSPGGEFSDSGAWSSAYSGSSWSSGGGSSGGGDSGGSFSGGGGSSGGGGASGSW